MNILKLLVSAVASVIATGAWGAEYLNLSLSATPPNPIIGEEVVWTAVTTGGGYYYSKRYVNYAWRSDQLEFPDLTQGDLKRFRKMSSVTNVYSGIGNKSVTNTVWNGAESVERALTLHVAQGRITDVVVEGGAKSKWVIWYVGETYRVTWQTDGLVGSVLVAISDQRFDPGEAAGYEVLIYDLPNTGEFFFTVPPGRPDGVSQGKLRGQNYRIHVVGLNDSYPGTSDLFTIRPPRSVVNKY
jgi:hypothetical protein